MYLLVILKYVLITFNFMNVILTCIPQHTLGSKKWSRDYLCFLSYCRILRTSYGKRRLLVGWHRIEILHFCDWYISFYLPSICHPKRRKQWYVVIAYGFRILGFRPRLFADALLALYPPFPDLYTLKQQMLSAHVATVKIRPALHPLCCGILSGPSRSWMPTL